MKNQALLSFCLHRLSLFTTSLVLAGLLSGPTARAGLTVDIHTYRYPGLYVTYGWLNTNAIAPAAPLGNYLISSPNGSFLRYLHDTNGFNYLNDGGGTGSSDFSSFMNALTNGQWSIQVTNASSTNTYLFNVSATGLNSNLFNTATITYPANNAQNITNDPTFTWAGGPIGWLGTAEVTVQDEPYNNYYESATLPPSATTWSTPNPPLPLGTNKFHLVYLSNVTATVVASIPRTASSNAISGWQSTASLEVNSDEAIFNVIGSGNAFDAYLVARYNFENTNSPDVDTSGNDNNAGCGSGTGGTNLDTFSTDAVVGNFARKYLGDTGICFYPGSSAFANLSNAYYGSFSLCAWVKTTNTVNSDFANAYFGAPILFDYNSNTNGAILSITGSKAAFTISNPNGTDTIIHSTTIVNDGSYHFLVASRNATNGILSLYVDGHLEATGTSVNTPVELNTTMYLAGGYYGFFVGLLDDVRIYSTELSANDVAMLAGIQLPFPGGHKLVAHYTFDNTNNTFDLGLDSSPNDNNLSGYGYWGQVHTNITPAKAGASAVEFFGTSSLNANDQVLTNLNTVLAGSFSFSTWVKTTSSRGNDSDNAYFGATIFWAFNDHNSTNDTIPLAITGSKAAFTTRGGDPGAFDNLHSTTSVTDGNYHLITVTRNQSTGEKKIYVDGNLENSEIGTTNPLNGNDYYLSIGGTVYSSYTGILDDLQVYSGVLSENDVAYLFSHPGSNVVDTTGQDFNTALNTTNLAWIPAGDTDWFVESTNTHDTVSAAQSGVVTNSQTSTLQTTVTGPGTLTFYWSSFAEDPNFSFDFEFDIDGDYQNDIYGDQSWIQSGPYNISAGQHTLSWTVHSNGDTDPTQAGYLDQVSFISTTPDRVTLLNPQKNGVNFQFQFLSQSGKTNTVQSRTNLSLGVWIDRTNILGDGSPKTVTLPVSSAPTEFFRVSTQ